MKTKRLLSLLLVLILLAALFSGCGSSASDSSEEETETADSTSGETEAPEDADTEDTTGLPEDYPLLCDDGSITLTVFTADNTLLAGLMETYSDLYWWQELSERTGVSFDWNMAASASAEEQFNLLIAADDLPNLVCTGNYYSDGISSAVEDEIFVDLSGYLADYAPDYLEVISQEDVYPAVTDENGSIIFFYEIGFEEYAPNSGVFLRGDLLEEQGLDVPVTYEEYEEMLLALKTAYDIEAPVYFEFESFSGSTDFGKWLSSGQYVQMSFSLDADGNCIYGPIEDGYREYLSIINRWYEEGLLYSDFYSITDSLNNMLEYFDTGKSIMFSNYCEWMGMISLDDEDGYLVPGYLPRVNEDDELHLTDGIDKKVQTGTGYGIGPNSTEEEIQTICMLMNWFYTEEGALFANYGVEGVTFEYDEDGNPWYTELITDNPDGLSLTQALFTYIGYKIPAHADYAKYNIVASTTYAEFVELWSSSVDNAWDMPQVSLTAEEQEDYSAVSTDVTTYLDETIVKFITGDMDVDDDSVWQEYLDTLDALGVNTMIEIYSAALERYNSR